MNNGNSAINLRSDYNAGVASLRAAGLTWDETDKAVLSQSYLRLEQLLVGTTNTFKFPILSNQTGNGQGIRNTEKRLKLQDAFYVATTNIYLTKASSATSSALLLNTYPNVIVFATAGEAAALEAFYNGWWSLTVNNVVIIPGFDLMQYRQVYQTQLTAATNSPIDMFDGTNNVINQPNPVLIGQKDNFFQIELPAAIAGTVDPFIYIVVIMRGVLAQNVTVVS
jgi:hypothetical protein